jgi:hypothetical protein
MLRFCPAACPTPLIPPVVLTSALASGLHVADTGLPKSASAVIPRMV